MSSQLSNAMSFSISDAYKSPDPEPYYPNEKEKIKATVKEVIYELLGDEKFIEFLKEKLKSRVKDDKQEKI